MPYLVTGRVHPERADVNISPMTSIVDGGITIFLVCESSQLTVAIQDVAPIDGYKSAFILAEGWASTAFGSVGLLPGHWIFCRAHSGCRRGREDSCLRNAAWEPSLR